MKIKINESLVIETMDGSQFRIGMDAECGDHGFKITALDGRIFSAQLSTDVLLIKSIKK